jgi:rare lipoprotein A (peptidoglycan hydrolase)
VVSILVAASVAFSALGVGAGAGGVQHVEPASAALATAAAELRGRPHPPNVDGVAGRPRVKRAVGHHIAGIASWYAYHPGQAAAGPRLRAALGSHWRGRVVRVNGIRVRLTDWCGCPSGRVIDLHRADFARLARPSAGLIRVIVTW